MKVKTPSSKRASEPEDTPVFDLAQAPLPVSPINEAEWIKLAEIADRVHKRNMEKWLKIFGGKPNAGS